jgi:predicted TPR repeat methyltransferase
VLEEKLFDPGGATAAFRTAARLDPEDVLGAAVRLGRLLPSDPEARMSQAYVAKLFDQYAPRFESHLTGQLDYRGPEIIMAALRAVCGATHRPLRFATALDLGCGTGLMARTIGAHVDAIDGVDISPEMVRLAQASGLYRNVLVGDVMAALALPSPAGESTHGRYSLVLAADVLCYMNDLTQLFNAVAQAIPRAGLFAFTCQSNGKAGVMLGDDLRYSHARDYLHATAAAAGLAVDHMAPAVVRRDHGRDVPGHVVVLRHVAIPGQTHAR